MGIGSISGSYFNFILGTGSEETGKIIKRQLKNRVVNNQSYLGALYKGTKKGIGYSHALQKKNGGFFKSLKTGFRAIPDGWKSGKGFGKLTGAFKGLGKAMPAAMAILALVGEVPNIIKATKEKGAGQGLKEVGKAGVRLTTGALCAAIGTAILPVGGSIAGWFLGDWIGSKIAGKSYSEKADTEAKPVEFPQEENAVANTGTSQSVNSNSIIDSAPLVEFPSIHVNESLPYSQSYFSPIGMYGVNPMLSNYTTPMWNQNPYSQQPVNVGKKLDISTN